MTEIGSRARRRPGRRLLATAATAVTLIGGSVAVSLNAGAAVPPAQNGWTLVFSDDFTGAAGSG